MEAAEEIKRVYHHLWYECHGPLLENSEALSLFEKLHSYRPVMNDTRFVYYAERRSIHLIKLSLILAACRYSEHIEVQDVAEAHFILCHTEKAMPDALGEYGLSVNAKHGSGCLSISSTPMDPLLLSSYGPLCRKI